MTKPSTGARLCTRCGTRVDERRGRNSPFCLSCGQPLRAPTRGSTVPPGGGSNAILWIIGGLFVGGAVLVVGAIVFIVKLRSQPEGVAAPSPSTSGPIVEAPSPSASSSSKTATPSTGTNRVPIVASPIRSSAPIDAGRPRDAAVNRIFPTALASSEMDRAARQASFCKRPEGPNGTALVAVTFEPDERVQVRLGSPFARTPVGDCITRTFESVKVGAFEGSSRSLSRSFVVGDPRSGDAGG